MGFDNLAVGYAKSSSDLSTFTIGLLRSFGSLTGMIGVLSYTIMEKRIGLVKAGLVGMIVQQICSLVAVFTIWMPGSPFFEHQSQGFSVLIFLIAIATARYGMIFSTNFILYTRIHTSGLWCLDITKMSQF
ncbi:hypothetical protein B9Z55_016870 [Caenorhabditis nigoni]|uniref:Solute carrier family 40 member n=1 Tax=Caenorhabditis nigoni TaxID=1611254 RepID=A0A2G5T781_9PELO|nr:hypothetical protein B9Z55_016870 [Caenorhabditis nigoni]